MKNSNTKSTSKAVLAAIFTLSFSLACFAQRNTVWIGGVSINSNGWTGMKQEMDVRGYQFEDLMNSFYDSSLGVEAAADQVEGMIGNEGNVLGIAHDYGGIVLRDLQLQDPSVTAMILDGVPNQGSSGIFAAIFKDGPSSLSKAQKIVQTVNNVKEGDECNDCGFVEAFESWIDEMEGAEDFLDDVQEGSPIIANLNSPTNMPTVPFAILWGSVEQLSLTRLMSSRGFPFSDGDVYTKCYTETLSRERQEAKEAFIRNTISNTQGFFASIFSAVGTIISAATGNPPNIGQMTAAIGTYINSQRTNIVNQIQAVQQQNAELARILRCELANQLLAAEWQLALMNNSLLEEVEVEVPFYGNEYYDCLTECGVDMAWGDWDMPGVTCEEWCEPEIGTTTEIITVFVSDPNDGLLTQSEQMLEGAQKVYHLVETNHFQETYRAQEVVPQALEDLFDGGAGAAFIVPK